MKPIISSLLSIFCAGALCLSCQESQQTEGTDQDFMNESREAFDERMAWWREARFGMFIHWGPYAVPAGVHQGDSIEGIGEWIMQRAQVPVAEYEAYSRAFNPVEFDAREWVRIAKDAGMKYIVITSKHHDGFCLWDSDVTEYDIMDTSPYGQDLLQQLSDACQEAGIRLCFYHSIMDWHHPDAQAPFYPNYNDGDKTNPNFRRYVDTYLFPQIEELVVRYDPDVLWFDGEWIKDWTHEDGVRLYNHARSLKPSLLINNRVDKGRQGMQGMNKGDQQYAGDFGTPEQEILEGTSNFDWESCMTMNDTWGYKSWDHNWKSAETLVHNLVDIAAKGGNYLLNVGPTAEGLIPQPSVERLAEIGDWMDVNEEAIYGSRLWATYHEGKSIRYTQTQDDAYVYAISLGWPGETLDLSAVVPEAGSAIRLLGHEASIPWEKTETGIRLRLPDELQQPENRPCKYAFAFKIQGQPAADMQASVQ